MDTLYERNGLIFWTEKEIRLRNMLADYFVNGIKAVLKTENRAFELIQVEAPILTPQEFINKNYTADDFYRAENTVALDPNDFKPKSLILRPETTMGSYQYAKWLLEHTETKTRLPICIWQHGKSFRREQDQVTKNMRLKEFYQLEFQCIYGMTTANDYSKAVIPAVQKMISDMIGPCRTEESDRLPDYSERTTDVICEKTNMEVCSISSRKDFVSKVFVDGKLTDGFIQSAKVLEVAIGTDRCVFNFLDRTENGN
jgi:glycyl-tRNA synthetase